MSERMTVSPWYPPTSRILWRFSLGIKTRQIVRRMTRKIDPSRENTGATGTEAKPVSREQLLPIFLLSWDTLTNNVKHCYYVCIHYLV
jgi:hypothetical protein